ncbi:hypothetical protein [Leucobacter chromiireducens]|uniref:hypothetical protein n=1 Tax=Leucobacter chromiireducens TaxID=283877 RepID=UPI003F813897
MATVMATGVVAVGLLSPTAAFAVDTVDTAPTVDVEGASGEAQPVSVAAGSGIDWGFDPADHPRPGDADNSWGNYGEYVGSTYWSFQWFMNYTDQDQLITGYDLIKTGAYGNVDMSTCPLPIPIPAGGSASCEFSYEMDYRDADRVTIDLSWVGDDNLELDSTIKIRTEGSKPTEPTKPVDPVDPKPVDPVDPIDPVDPVDPVNPVDPVDPVPPVDPKPVPPVNPTVPDGPQGESGATPVGVKTDTQVPATLAETGSTPFGVLAGAAATILAAGAGLLGFAAKRRQAYSSI